MTAIANLTTEQLVQQISTTALAIERGCRALRDELAQQLRGDVPTLRTSHQELFQKHNRLQDLLREVDKRCLRQPKVCDDLKSKRL